MRIVVGGVGESGWGGGAYATRYPTSVRTMAARLGFYGAEA